MIKIIVKFVKQRQLRGAFDYALDVHVEQADGVSPKIFVYHQLPATVDGALSSEFDHVASPADMHEIPEDAASDTVPWYRTNSCTIWCRSAEDFEQAKQLFVDDIQLLQKNLTALSNMDDENATVLEFSNEGVKKWQQEKE